MNNKIKAGLYIHIPFCLSKCAYCSFYSIKSISLIPDYLAALRKEIKFYSKSFRSFDTVYIGGGTPSILSSEHLSDIFSAIHKTYRIDAGAEITMELNPGDTSLEYLKMLRTIGVNRLNIGIQAFDDKLLKFLGRRHSASQAIAAISTAREAGFGNLGIDLIYGVYGTGIKSWKNTLQKAVSFAPEHISCYQLSLDKKTPLYKKYYREGWSLPDENTERNLFFINASELEKTGYIHYEVSNFAISENLRSRHNMKYWRHVPYLGLGPGAHSFSGGKRWWNKPSVKKYLITLANGEMPVENSEKLTQEQLQLETIFLGLRTKDGVDLGVYKQKYGLDLLAEKKTMISTLLANKLVRLDNNILSPTCAGMAVADSLALI
ncbi:MAG: Oxygen-independent coproporphyrinogen-III oxidase 1 [Smithella sp. PtaU1.Bin162]|nr:MAG: Oxygen-independent coproporphyrinogen-III oxidase 1 [Smithella sp. PtaU1.Bin162]